MQRGDEGLINRDRTSVMMHPEQQQGINYYSILDVDPQAPRMAIREAYLRLKNAYGSGSAALYSLLSADEAADQVAQIEAAFRVLGDDVARRAYDLESGFGVETTPLQRKGAILSDARGFAEEPRRGFGSLESGRLDSGRLDAGRLDSGRMEAGQPQAGRTALPSIKLRASMAAADEVQASLKEILSSCDPSDGEILRRLREACGVSEEEICESTKVSQGYIQAIEANRFERLPQAVFVKGFLRSFCRYLCVPDPEVIVAAFSARLTDWQSNRKA